MKAIKVFAPATVANVGCGFDVLGFALDRPGDEVIVTLRKNPGVIITKITGDGGCLPYDVKRNTAGVSVSHFLKHIKSKQGVEIELHKKMPLGSGLGSSAASAVAAVVAINELFGNTLQRKELLPFAMEGERAACGSAHADNVAPSLFGGFVIIRSYNPLDVIKINAPEKLVCAIIHPHVEVKTKDARRVLKKEIPLKDAVVQWGNVAGLIAGIITSDYPLIGRSIQDVIAEPARSALIPGFYKMKQAALKAGALGCSISGSGSSLFALTTSIKKAHEVVRAMKNVLDSLKIGSDEYISKINQKGAYIIN